MIDISSESCYIIRVENNGYRCSSLEDLKNMDGFEDFKVEVSLPLDERSEKNYDSFDGVLEDLKNHERVLDDAFLMDLIRTLETKALEVSYEGKDGKVVQAILPGKVRKAYQNYLYDSKLNDRERTKIYFALAEILMREKVGEAFAKVVDEKEVHFKELGDYKLKEQFIKLNELKLVDFYDSFKLKAFKNGDELLKYLYLIFGFLSKKYKKEGDFSRNIEDAQRIIFQKVFSED